MEKQLRNVALDPLAILDRLLFIWLWGIACLGAGVVACWMAEAPREWAMNVWRCIDGQQRQGMADRRVWTPSASNRRGIVMGTRRLVDKGEWRAGPARTEDAGKLPAVICQLSLGSVGQREFAIVDSAAGQPAGSVSEQIAWPPQLQTSSIAGDVSPSRVS